jgi:hypothetical protein
MTSQDPQHPGFPLKVLIAATAQQPIEMLIAARVRKPGKDGVIKNQRSTIRVSAQRQWRTACARGPAKAARAGDRPTKTEST